jgi:hypothetical protein
MRYDVVSQTAPEVPERSGGRNRSLPAQDRANSFVGMLNYYLSRCLRRYRHAMRVTVMLKQPDHQLPLVLWTRQKAGAMPLMFSVGPCPSCGSANAKRSRRNFIDRTLLCSVLALALRLLSLSLFSVARDGERLI